MSNDTNATSILETVTAQRQEAVEKLQARRREIDVGIKTAELAIKANKAEAKEIDKALRELGVVKKRSPKKAKTTAAE